MVRFQGLDNYAKYFELEFQKESDVHATLDKSCREC